jgi:hypothetical protein
MHNSTQANLEFQITFTETNLRYLYGAEPLNVELIQKHEKTMAELKEKLARLNQKKSTKTTINSYERKYRSPDLYEAQISISKYNQRVGNQN